MLIGPGVTVRAVGADMLTVTLSVEVDPFPATSVALTTTELDTENSGTVHEKLEPLRVAGMPPQETPATPESASLTEPAMAT